MKQLPTDSIFSITCFRAESIKRTVPTNFQSQLEIRSLAMREPVRPIAIKRGCNFFGAPSISSYPDDVPKLMPDKHKRTANNVMTITTFDEEQFEFCPGVFLNFIESELREWPCAVAALNYIVISVPKESGTADGIWRYFQFLRNVIKHLASASIISLRSNNIRI